MQPRRDKQRDLVVVVVGPREGSNRQTVWSVMDRANKHKPIAAIVHGGTPGTEQLASEWARQRGIKVIVCAGDWEQDKEIAVIRRNARMIAVHRPDGVIIFPGAVLGDDLAARARAERIGVWSPYLRRPQGPV